MGKVKQEPAEQEEQADVSVKTDALSYDDKVNNCSVIAKPMAPKKLSKKIYKLIKKSSSHKNHIKNGLKIVQKQLRLGEKGIRLHRVSVQQLQILCEFLNSHRDLAIAHNRSLQDKEKSKRKWIEVAEILNSQGDGTHKEWYEWSKYWVDYKAKLKRRVSDIRSAQNSNGAGPSREHALAGIERKFLEILGDDFGQGSPGVRGEPSQDAQEAAVPHIQRGSFPAAEFKQLVTFLEPVQNVQIELHPEDHSIVTPEESPSPEPMLQDPLHSTTPPMSATASSPPSTRVDFPRRRYRREPPMSQEAARRSLVMSSNRRAVATERIADALTGIQGTLERIERLITGAVSEAEM